MFKGSELDEKIINSFSMLHGKISYNTNILGFTDDNRKAEILFRDIYNIMYDANFKHCDSSNFNNKAIDLIDVSEESGVAVQITSTNTMSKINDTIKAFKEEYSNSNIEVLEILIIGVRKPLKENKIEHFEAEINCKVSIIDINKLIKFILGLDVEKKQKILEYLNKNLANVLRNDNFIDDEDVLEFGEMEKIRNFYINQQVNEKVWDEYYFVSIKEFFLNIQSLSKEARKFLFSIIKNRIDANIDEGVMYNPYELTMKVKLSIESFHNYIFALGQKKIRVDFESRAEENICSISYLIGKPQEEFDFISDLIEISEINEVSLKDLIVELRIDLLE